MKKNMQKKELICLIWLTKLSWKRNDIGVRHKIKTAVFIFSKGVFKQQSKVII